MGATLTEFDRELAVAIDTVIDAAKELDPTDSVPVYDLHDANGGNTGYCLVRTAWIDNLWSAEYPGELIPHDHLDPSFPRVAS